MKLFDRWFRRVDTAEAAALARYEHWRQLQRLGVVKVLSDESSESWPETMRIARNRWPRR